MADTEWHNWNEIHPKNSKIMCVFSSLKEGPYICAQLDKKIWKHTLTQLKKKLLNKCIRPRLNYYSQTSGLQLIINH